MGRRGRSRLGVPVLGALVGLLIWAPAAQASFHLIKVREVYAGTNEDSYVELQMYAAGQNFLGGHSLTLYNSAGALSHTSTFSSTVANSQNQRTVLVGDSGVEAGFGVMPDLVDAGLAVPAAGGAACWNAGGIPADCVAWGNFSGGTALQSATGTSAGSPASPSGIAAGKAIRRTIEPGCPTLLEESDDGDVSSTDFSEVVPAPRNNASTIVEATCAGAPNTAIDEKPPLRSNRTSAEFTYEAPTATSYQCKLDSAAFATCPNDGPQGYSGLADGSHTFQVRGVNASGPDPTPASYTWTVDTQAPTVTIDSQPADPSSGASAEFTFHASEAATFQCSLVPAGQPSAFSACASGKSYTGLGDGEYTFAVRPTDLATNTGAPASLTWRVDNTLADTTPPQTTIAAKPADPSIGPTAFFGYQSSEPGSSFECALDGSAFSACPAAGISYSRLAAGLHTFQVRAIDASANVDPTPAGYSFSVVLETPAPAAPAPVTAPAAVRPAPAARAAPRTIISAKPAPRTRDRTPTFRFRADRPGASFECALDRGPFKRCRSPFTSKKLSFGPHAFSVRSVFGGLADRSPARFAFKVLRGR